MIIKQAKILSNKYDIVVTNPPYINLTAMSLKLKDYILKQFADYKYDMFSAFIKRNTDFGLDSSYLGFMTPNVWLFISSYEKTRNYIINNANVSSLIQLAKGSFFSEATVDVCTFVLKNKMVDIDGKFYRLENYKRTMEDQQNAFLKIVNNHDTNAYVINNTKFSDVPNHVFAYWISKKILNAFEKGIELKKIGDTRQGMATSNNNRFLRLWFENDFTKIGLNFSNSDEAKKSYKKWFPYNKGGYFRKWYGNLEYTIDYENDGYAVKKYAFDLYKTPTRTIKSMSEYFKDSISWSKISSGDASFRFFPKGFIFDVAGCCIFTKSEEEKLYLLAFLNTVVANNILKMISPTLNYEAGQIAILPILNSSSNTKKIIEKKVLENISISKQDWDLDETSWDFIKHPLLMPYSKAFTIRDSLSNYYSNIIVHNFNLLKHNEEELNRIFIDIYGLQDELTPEESDKDVTIRKADKVRDIKSFISYAVGCMFGRYSLDEDGLVYAGGEFDSSKYKTFKADVDNVIPITDEAYFADDIVERFKKFVETAFGKVTLTKNIDFIAETLGKKGTETSEETIRRYFLNDFYSDHIKTYQKRPIYWLFDSGKKNGFKALIYMHRYNENTIPKVRLDYLHRIQTTYDKLLSDVNYRLTTDLSINDKKQAQNRQADLNAKLQEINEYDEKIAHIANQRISIDLDDGVKINYEKFKDILAKIK